MYRKYEPVEFVGMVKEIFDLDIHGTALNITINLDQNKNLKKILEEIRNNIPIEVKIKPSKSSMGS